MVPFSLTWWAIWVMCQALVWFPHDMGVAIFGVMLTVCHWTIVTCIHFRNMSERWK